MNLERIRSAELMHTLAQDAARKTRFLFEHGRMVDSCMKGSASIASLHALNGVLDEEASLVLGEVFKPALDAEDRKKEDLTSGIGRKIKYLIDENREHGLTHQVKDIGIPTLGMQDWEQNPFPINPYEWCLHSLELSATTYNGAPQSVILRLRTKRYDFYSFRLFFENSGSMKFVARHIEQQVGPDDNWDKSTVREASLEDLRMFDKVLDSAVSQVLGDLPWEKQMVKSSLARGKRAAKAFMGQSTASPEAAMELRYPHS
jgi:hypothetical protein